MNLSYERLNTLCQSAIAAACLAGDCIMTHYGRIEDIGSKGREQMAGDVVTLADQQAQSIILSILRPLDPEIGIVAEEEGQDADRSRFEKECFWCIDPLDGTLPFIERINGFGVSIALVTREGEPLIGVAHLPALGETYWAVKGGKAYKNGKEINLEKQRGTLRLSFAWPDVATPEGHARFLHIVKRLKEMEGCKSVEMSLHSGAVIKACRVADKPPAIYLSFPRPAGASIWDFAATACILKAAGAWVSDIYGNPMDLNRADSTYMHYRGILYASDAELAKTVLEAYTGFEAGR